MSVVLLNRFAQHKNWELSHVSEDEGSEYWAVHKRVGNRNDSEWNLIGRGRTPREAIVRALESQQKDEGRG